MIWIRMISLIKIYLKRIRFWINLLIIADPELVHGVKKQCCPIMLMGTLWGESVSRFWFDLTRVADPWHFCMDRSGSADPCLWLMNPEPDSDQDSDLDLDIFVIYPQDVIICHREKVQKKSLNRFFLLVLLDDRRNRLKIVTVLKHCPD